jgi:hypothetical protein
MIAAKPIQPVHAVSMSGRRVSIVLMQSSFS